MNPDFLDDAAGAPIYKDARRTITQSLEAGEWKLSEAISSEKELAECFGASIGTLRKAVHELTIEIVLIRNLGRGTDVSSHERGRFFLTFFHMVRQDGLREIPTVEPLSF
ncbi:MAG: GntR family transcriptional regulator [Proteobacteria bacterium]|nr:GntR family transcriptional regulator [Pseudomonadota bacterium]